MSTHHFECSLEWTGAAHGPILDYEGYSREARIDIAGKPPLSVSAATAFRGDAALHNPEDLLVAALSACHFLSYAAFCARRQIVVVSYRDRATGTMAWDPTRKVIAFTEVVLRPHVVVAQGSDFATGLSLHDKAHEQCFIARSVNFTVRHEASLEIAA